MGCHFFLQGIFPTQGSNPGLLQCRRILDHLSHHRSPVGSTDYKGTTATAMPSGGGGELRGGQETPAHSQDSSAPKACQPVLPPSCGTILKAVDLASGSPSGLCAASPWVKVMGRVGLGERCQLGVGSAASMTTNQCRVLFLRGDENISAGGM